MTRKYFHFIQQYRWCNGYSALLEWLDLTFERLSGQIKDYKIFICCFSAQHAALRRNSKD